MIRVRGGTPERVMKLAGRMDFSGLDCAGDLVVDVVARPGAVVSNGLLVIY